MTVLTAALTISAIAAIVSVIFQSCALIRSYRAFMSEEESEREVRK